MWRLQLYKLVVLFYLAMRATVLLVLCIPGYILD
jgi:hypothetical protein